MKQSDNSPAEQGSKNDDGVSARDALVTSWLHHFGVEYLQELDLGTLEMLGQLIRDGCTPPTRA
ncbi:hypothetical protein [Cupriavidus numazuensis]|uniref:Uncharacterized protein n=1 Tax=Cupriavidus numazuensis TaxID=221992 RepID=A0ABM8TQN2_9BURK|nr:hypothetical protein [Cupriavidus numazuensis]CAG2158229.1 hypothetical protein LMG26411_05888 [Cupriavidus numazuensis]